MFAHGSFINDQTVSELTCFIMKISENLLYKSCCIFRHLRELWSIILLAVIKRHHLAWAVNYFMYLTLSTTLISVLLDVVKFRRDISFQRYSYFYYVYLCIYHEAVHHIKVAFLILSFLIYTIRGYLISIAVNPVLYLGSCAVRQVRWSEDQ